MDLNLQTSSVSDLKPFKSAWQVHVKLLHSWNSFHTTTGSDLEMVLTDVNVRYIPVWHYNISYGVKIQAICKQSLLQRLQMHCDVGKWKVINNFTLSPATGIYRHTDHVYKIHFLSQTTITDSNLQCENMFLDLKDFRDIINGSHDKRFLIDIVGQAIEVSEIQTINTNGGKEKKKIEFQLRDISDQRIPCCLWGNFAEAMESHREEAQFGVVVCKDVVTKSNPRSGQKLDSWKDCEDLNVSELLGCTQVKKCKVVATICAIDTDYAWYYFGSKFVLLDWIAWPVIGVTAEKILDGSLDEIEDPELLPACIKDLVGKTFKFGVTIEKGVEIFKVLKVWSVFNTVMVEFQSETMLERESTTISGSEGSLLTYSDESSSKMTTPSKRTADEIAEIPDNTSTSKIRPIKNIKVEKMSSEEISIKKN
ncbi:hypothetical protein Bca52824_000985 [Brassica carinata]|uniref:DUF223 domain-containing protein n=1 Tax=Brassica carinata TaxID=52824 RepID=A0A8X7WJ69_BRACI|nr:hypothetical protein Bca52824_000985 [Brassica carinata]